jgi:hypothetical protein
LNQIFEKAQSYRAAFRVAQNEREKIEQLKKETENQATQLTADYDQEKALKEENDQILSEIADLKKVTQQATDLPEEQTLRGLESELGDITK